MTLSACLRHAAVFLMIRNQESGVLTGSPLVCSLMHLSQQQAGLFSVSALCRFGFQGRRREMEILQSELLHSKKSATEKWYMTNVHSFPQSHYTGQMLSTLIYLFM